MNAFALTVMAKGKEEMRERQRASREQKTEQAQSGDADVEASTDPEGGAPNGGALPPSTA